MPFATLSMETLPALSDLLECEPLVFVAKTLMNLVFTLVVMKIGSKIFSKKEKNPAFDCCEMGDPMDPTGPEPPHSPAAAEALTSLYSGHPLYNSIKHTLHCPGLIVEFSSEGPSPVVIRALAAPALQNGSWSGTDVYPLVSGEERLAITEAAWEVREAVIGRDLAQLNQDAANRMLMARYKDDSAPAIYQYPENPVNVSACNIPPPSGQKSMTFNGNRKPPHKHA